MHVASIEATTNKNRVLLVTPEGKRALERRSRKYKNGIKMTLEGTEGYEFDSSGLTYK